MGGELGRDRRRPLSVRGFDGLADLLMQPSLQSLRNLGVGRVAVQLMAERVVARRPGIGPLGSTGEAEKRVRPRQRLAPRLGVLDAASERRGHRLHGKLLAHDAGHLKQSAIGRAEAIKLHLDHPAGIVGHLQLQLLHRGAERPARSGFENPPARQHILEHGDDEERVSVRVFVQQSRQLCGEFGAGETLLQVALHLFRVQLVQRQIDTLPSHLQGPHGSRQHVMLNDGFRRAIGADDQQASRLAALGEHAEQVDGCRIAPVEVLEHEHDGQVGAQRFDQRRELARHAFGPGRLQRLP